MHQLHRIILILLTGILYACGGGNSNGSNHLVLKLPSISGRVTFDLVNHDPSTSALDYSSITEVPVRGATVQLIDASTVNDIPKILGTVATNENGEYQFDNRAPQGAKVIVRVLAQLDRNISSPIPTAYWFTQVIDNTNDDAVYAMDSISYEVKEDIKDLNLHAASGWGGTDYNAPRVAAPFAILDSAYIMIEKLRNEKNDIHLPPLYWNWSINNVPVDGNVTQGRIGTSYYSDSNIYILGAEDSDTDEYDDHVIIHEAAHYFEDKLSRSDSIGGSHGSGDYLDITVAFSEGFGNAWSGIISDDPSYHDSSGDGQTDGFEINVEFDSASAEGWFSEDSVQEIIYDLYDSNDDGTDTVSLGLTPILDVMLNQQKNTPALTSIFSFITYLKEQNSSSASLINNRVSSENIVSSTIDIWGSTETNDAGLAATLPIYITDNSTYCSVNDFDDDSGNKLGIRRYARFDFPAAGTHTLTVSPTGGNEASVDMDWELFENGVTLSYWENEGDGVDEIMQDAALPQGQYLAIIYEYGNVSSSSKASQDSCFNVFISSTY